MTKIRIGVTGINAVDNPGPGTGVIRSLKEDAGLDVEAVGLAYDAMDPGIYMDWLVDRAYLLPYPSANGDDYLQRLQEIKARVGLDIVVPTLDSELPLFITAADELERIVARDSTYLIEINHRFPAWVYFATGVGINLPARLVRTLLGLPVEGNGTYAAGKLYVRYTTDMVTDMTTFQNVVTRAERQ